MNLVEFQRDDLAEPIWGGPLMRLVARNGVAVAIGGEVYLPRTVWLCRWFEVGFPGAREQWFGPHQLRLFKRL